MNFKTFIQNRAGWFSLLVCAVVVVGNADPAFAADQWGDLKAKFLFKGAPPQPKPLRITGECAPHKLVDERLIVSKSGGVANVVVYLMPNEGQKVPVHPDIAKAQPKTIRVDNANCRFEPHVAIAVAGQVVEFGNKDPFGHNVKGDCFNNVSFNVLAPAGGKVSVPNLTKAERTPIGIACNIHPFMAGHLLVAATPYAAVSDSEGSVTIDKIPVGTWTFVLWHESQGFLKAPSLKRGKTSVTIKGDQVTDLGTFEFQ